MLRVMLFCKSFHVLLTKRPSFINCLKPSVDEKRNNRLQSETLRLKNSLNKMSTNTFYDVWLKGNQVLKECSIRREVGKERRWETRVPRGSRTTQSGGNSEPSENVKLGK